MGTRVIATKLVLDGESEFKQKIASVNSEISVLSSELKQTEERFKGQANSMEALTAKGGALQNLYDKQAEKVRELSDILESAKSRQQDYAEGTAELKKTLAATEDQLASLKNKTGDTADEQQRLSAEVSKLDSDLRDSIKYQDAAEQSTAKWQVELNKAQSKLNNLDTELQQNKRYLSEASTSADKCAVSIDKYGKQTKQAATETGNAAEKGGMLSKIFAGGMLANIATQALNAVVSKLKELIATALETADELKRMSSVTGLTTDQLQEFTYIGDDVGVSVDTISGALKRLTNNMEAAKAGSGDAYDAFDALGIKFRDDVTGELLNSTEVFSQVIEALSNMANETERDALAQDLLGKSATELNPLIELGAEGMKELADESHNAGAVMSEETVGALDSVGDRLAHIWNIITTQFVSAFATTGIGLAKMAGQYDETGKQAETLTDKVSEIEASYDSAYAAALKSLKGQVSLWEDMSDAVNMSFSDIKSAIDSQNRYYIDYSTNLSNLSMRNVEGVDALVTKLSDGSAKSAAILGGLATASDDEIRQLINSMDEASARQDGLARQIAQTKTNTMQQLSDLYSGVRDTANQLNASDVAARAASDTMQGYIDSIRGRKQEVVDAFKDVARSANQGFKDELQIKSPSRVAMKVSDNYWDGLLIATQQKEAELSDKFAEVAAKANKAAMTSMPSSVEVPQNNAQSAEQISQAITRGLASSQATGGQAVIVVDLTSNTYLDGIKIGVAQKKVQKEVDAIAGTNLINEV